MFNFTTGPTLVPDIGALSYSGCVFGPLFETKVSSNMVKDEARRTVKLVEHTIEANGYVTLPVGVNTDGAINGPMGTLYKLLTAQGGKLVYSGRALDIVVNAGDLAYGPVPELIEFQPMGGGRSAKILWKIKVRQTPQAVANANSIGVLQLNYDTSVSYDEAGYSSLSIKGTIEIPINRGADRFRNLTQTVDDFRSLLENRILRGIDLTRFHLTTRVFNVSRDKRTMEWEIGAQEKPFMDLPPDCTLAHGSYNVRPVKTGNQVGGLTSWLCTLRATYTLAAGVARKRAYWAFLALMFLRAQQGKRIEKSDNPPANNLDEFLGLPELQPLFAKGFLTSKNVFVNDFSIDEGVYLDSRTVSFSMTWRILCRLSQILIGGGVWRRLPDGGKNPNTNWWVRSMTVQRTDGNILGTQSWLPNTLDPGLDYIVDMGSVTV